MTKKFAKVQFNSNTYGKDYVFKNDIEDLEVGDQVVVDTRYGYSVATVIEFMEQSNIGSKYLVQKIDISAHKVRLEKERKLKEIKAKMDARRKKLEEIEIYEMLAKQDEEMAGLLKMLKEID